MELPQDYNEEKCSECGKNPPAGVMLVLVIISLLWLGNGFLLGQQFSDYHHDYIKAATDYTHAYIEIHLEECK